MKKRKLLLLPLALLCATSLTACNKGGDETSSSTATSTTSSVSGSSSATSSSATSSSAHTHEYSKDWSKDATNHWHADTCGHKTKKDVAAHTFVWGKCTVCGYTKATDGLKYVYSENGRYVQAEDKTKMVGEVVIPATYNGESVVRINDQAFYECTEMTGVIIPENVTLIREYAFMKCSKLSLVVLPASLKEINENAFSGCTALSTGAVYYCGSYEDWGKVTKGEGNDSLSNIYYYNEDKQDNDHNYWHYDDNGEPQVY